MINSTIKWTKYNGILSPKVPPHENINLSKNEIHALMKKYSPLMIRWTTNFDCKKETDLWYIVKDKFEDIQFMKRNIRYEIRKGQSRYNVFPVTKQYIAEHGYEAYINAFFRYTGYIRPETKDIFIRERLKASGEHWAVTDKISGKLIGFAKCDIHENCCMYTEIKIDPVHLSQYSNYALIYRMNEHYLSERKFLYVCDGLRNILHETNIQKYLINKFNFRRAYCNLNIHYSLLMLILIWILMPFKDIFYRFSSIKYFNIICALLKQEEIRKTFL